MSSRKLLCVAVASCLALLLLPSSVQAQVLGTLQGFISDESGAALPGVSVQVVNEETGAERTVFTDENGRYRAQALPAGPYSVTASIEGMQTVQQEDIQLLVGQVIDINLSLGVGEVSETITVTSESPLIEVSRSAAASYVEEESIDNLPISGRDFKDFAYLTPTVTRDNSRGFITMSGQRGIYSGLNIDGTDNKSAFFAYGRGGEATENDGLVVAQDSIKEFQVITNAFAPEYGQNGGGYINVITKSGTNDWEGNAFYLYRDDSFVEDLPSSPLDEFRGIDGSREPTEFERDNYGLSVGGPIVRDKTHFFVAYDQSNRDEPFTQQIRVRGVFDAILQRGQTEPELLQLLEGFVPNNDGVAAPDPVNGRTATGLFVRSVDNQILFAKVDHQFTARHSGSLRANITDFERTSSYKDEESLKVEDTTSYVGSLVSIFGENAINEFRFQSATDDLDRLSQRVGTDFEAEVRIGTFPNQQSLGKLDFLPILAEESKFQVQDNFSYLFRQHDLKFGFDYQEDNLKQLFAGSLDGRYDFNTIDDFLNNNARQVRIYFGDVTFPNYDEKQTVTSLYAQDSWRVNEQLTVNFGLRWQATDNPGDLEHAFEEGTNIPDDKDNIAPRLGFAYSLGADGRDVIRGGIGLFHSRTPTLLFASQVQENGLFPNFGRITVRPGQTGFVPLGVPIDNENPPRETIPSSSFVDPDFEDPETWRLNLGYERQLAVDWSAGVDFIYAEGDNLQSNFDLNRTLVGLDPFGRPLYAGDNRPITEFDQIFVRQSVGESEYTALTFKVNKRFSGRYSLNAHYTWSEDMDTDSNERDATAVTVSNQEDIRYDWGLSNRDIEHRVVVSGLVSLPWGFRIGGIVEWRSGTPYTAFDPANNPQNYPDFSGPTARAIIDGRVVERNSFRNEDVSRVDLRLSKSFNVSRLEIELFGEVFNLFDENSFVVTGSQLLPANTAGVANPEFGIPSTLITDQRQFQVGARVAF